MTKRLHLVHETTDANPKRVDGSDHVDTPAALGGCSGQPVNHRTHTGSRPVGQASHPHNQRHANTRARGSTKDDSVSAESSKVFNVSDDAVTPVEHSPENGPFDDRRDTAAGAFPSSLGAGGPPTYDWPKIAALTGAVLFSAAIWTVGVLAFLGALLAAACVMALPALILILFFIFERTLPDSEDGVEDRLACHVLDRDAAGLISRPIAKCSKCSQPVFLASLCAQHFEQYTDLAYDYSWEQSHDF